MSYDCCYILLLECPINDFINLFPIPGKIFEIWKFWENFLIPEKCEKFIVLIKKSWLIQPLYACISLLNLSGTDSITNLRTLYSWLDKIQFDLLILEKAVVLAVHGQLEPWSDSVIP